MADNKNQKGIFLKTNKQITTVREVTVLSLTNKYWENLPPEMHFKNWT